MNELLHVTVQLLLTYIIDNRTTVTVILSIIVGDRSGSSDENFRQSDFRPLVKQTTCLKVVSD